MLDTAPLSVFDTYSDEYSTGSIKVINPPLYIYILKKIQLYNSILCISTVFLIHLISNQSNVGMILKSGVDSQGRAPSSWLPLWRV